MNIIHDSVVDGPGLRTAVFFAGCPHFCKGCHNPASWQIKNGTDMAVEEVLEEITSNPLTNVTLTGGEPFFQAMEVCELAQKIKQLGKNIWVYSGYTFEYLSHSDDRYQRKLLTICDVLVDGPFILAERDLTLKFRGSRNQRIIDLSHIYRKNRELDFY